MRILRSVVALLAVAAFPAAAFAEVSDKAATIPQHWYLAIPIAFALFVAGSFRWWLGALLAIVPIFIVLGSIGLSLDIYVGSALWREQGWPYFASLWASDLFMFGGLALGIRQGLRDRRTMSTAPAA